MPCTTKRRAVLRVHNEKTGENPDFVDPDGDGAATLDLQRRYLYGEAVDQILAQEDISQLINSADRVLFPLTDHLGTVRDLARNDSSIATHFIYDSFGAILSGNTALTRYLFTSREFDADTNLQYNRARYYEASTGRFISHDPLSFAAGDTNTYRYVGNNATNATDPSGLSKKKGNGTKKSPTSIPPPLKNMEPGDIWVIVYVDQPSPGKRNKYVVPAYDYGHAFISVSGFTEEGKFVRRTRGFYPTRPWDSLGRNPQPGKVQSDVGKEYDVRYEFLVKKENTPSIPTVEEIFKFMESYDDIHGGHPYDFDDRNCADFVCDVMGKAGHPPLDAGVGELPIRRGNETKEITTPSALGEDLKKMGEKGLNVIKPLRAAPPTAFPGAKDIFFDDIFEEFGDIFAGQRGK